MFLKIETPSVPTDNKPVFPIRINTINAYSNLKNTHRDSIYDVENGQAEPDDVKNRWDHVLEEMLTFEHG